MAYCIASSPPVGESSVGECAGGVSADGGLLRGGDEQRRCFNRTREAYALVAVSAFVAGDNIGIFGGAWLASNPVRQYSPEELGIINAFDDGTKTLLTPVLGMLVDWSHWTRCILAAGIMCNCTAIALIVLLPQLLWVQIMAKTISAVALVLCPLGINALTLGTTAPEDFTGQVAGNQVGEHLGVLLSSAIMALVALIVPAIPLWSAVPALSASAAVCALQRIRYSRINQARGRGCQERDRGGEADTSAPSACDLARRPAVLKFMAFAFLFNVGNMPQTHLLVQAASARMPSEAIPFASCAQIIGKVGMTTAAVVVGRLANKRGRKPLLIVACAVLVARALVTSLLLYHGWSPWVVLLPCQILDGFGNGFYGPVSVLVAQDLSAGTGRFGLLFGLQRAAFFVGAVVSSVVSGEIAEKTDFTSAFGFLATVSAFAFVFVVFLIPETCPKNLHETRSEPPEAGAPPDIIGKVNVLSSKRPLEQAIDSKPHPSEERPII